MAVGSCFISMPALQFVLVLLAVVWGRPGDASTEDCSISVVWHDEIPARMIPVLSDSLTLTWQDRMHIYLQRYGSNCGSIGAQVVVNISTDFLGSPLESGLADAVRLEGSNTATAVVWVLNGDVFVSVVRDGQPGVAVRANSPTEGHCADARATPNPSSSGFLVSWRSWREENHSWGVFACRFDAQGQPVQAAIQLNQDGGSLDRDPQLAWCSTSMWASWKRDCIDEACSAGYILRHLGDSSALRWKPREEIVVKTGNGMSSALLCQGKNALLTWLEDDSGRMYVHWRNFSSVSRQAEKQSTVQDTVATRTWFDSFASSLGPDLSSLIRPLTVLPIFSAGNSYQLQRQMTTVLESSSSEKTGSRLRLGQPGPELEYGRINMVAQGDFVMILSSSSQGKLEMRLLDFSKGQLQMSGSHAVASGAQHARISLDTIASGLPGIAMCWGFTGENEGDSKFQCLKKGSWSLVDNDIFGLGGLTIPALFGALFCIFLVFRRCHAHGAGGLNGRNASAPRQSLTLQRRREQARTNELRQQLGQIPLQPLASQPPPSAEGATNESTQRVATVLPSSECAICQQEVVMRVALRPCGHTACRDCTAELIRLVQPCHICRGTIEGLLPVYT
eukprot:TRINITY_DN33772_c0_g1_i1.p1 TRINITY_DN33772_c0_g1~~TRINITY_DN33772_c0_g1_i1.p1  ORF type:complete len:620 (-),score=85.10 TRINITY_DN33772_c0_g1_i1:175-2034(-)